MQQADFQGRGFFAALRKHSLASRIVVALLALSALTVAVGSILGLITFRDVGYLDSATLLRIGEMVQSGHIYTNINQPPYYATLYGPLTYLLLGIPYALAVATGASTLVLVHFADVCAFLLCIFCVFLIGERFHSSRAAGWLGALFAASVTPLAWWSTEVRGDFIALAFSLLAIFFFLRSDARLSIIASAICAGAAVLTKQTFVAAPVAILIFLIFRRRYKAVLLWTASFVFVAVGGYKSVQWHESLMMSNLAAIRHPIWDYRSALQFIVTAFLQPVFPFAVFGAALILWKRASEKIFLPLYCLLAWLVAILTVGQVGGNLNYFWEPLFISAILAAEGLSEIDRNANRTPRIVAILLLLLLVPSFALRTVEDVKFLRRSFLEARKYRQHKATWQSFSAIVSGKRLLSTIPDVTIQSKVPEIPDAFLNGTLVRLGTWSASPVAAQIDEEAFALIIIRKGEAESGGGTRGIRIWSDDMWSTLKKKYTPACVLQGMGYEHDFERMEIWLPPQGSDELLHQLKAIGCKPEAPGSSLPGQPK